MNIKKIISIILLLILTNNYISALPKNHLQKAVAAMELGLFNEALKQIEIAKIKNPTNEQVYRLKALLHEAIGDYNKAISEWKNCKQNTNNSNLINEADIHLKNLEEY